MHSGKILETFWELKWRSNSIKIIENMLSNKISENSDSTWPVCKKSRFQEAEFNKIRQKIYREE